MSPFMFLSSQIPESSKSKHMFGSFTLFSLKVTFHIWASIEVALHNVPARILLNQFYITRKDSISKQGRHWPDVDIVVFSTYFWWRTNFKMKIVYVFNHEVKNFAPNSFDILLLKLEVVWVTRPLVLLLKEDSTMNKN
ncbi:hypothetical protein YC2023_078413 [Brassica napus]